MAPGGSVLAAIQAVLPQGVACAGGTIAEAAIPQFPEEMAAVAHAVARRRAEFFAGRHYARQALASLGCAPHVIPMSSSRAPVWPPGFCASISHTGAWCGAIAARRSDFAGVGFDVEPNVDLPAGTRAGIVAPGDDAASCAGALPAHVQVDTLIFVIKEAVYKLYWPMCEVMLDFHDVIVTLDGLRHSFVARIGAHCPAIRGSRIVTGRFGYGGGLLFAATTLPAQESAAAGVPP